jgi:hypothetical protein
MAKVESAPEVVVTGDVTMDWNLAHSQVTPPPRRGGANPQLSRIWNPDDSTVVSWQRGGAAMLADLIEAVAQNLSPPSQVRMMKAPRAPVCPTDPRYHHSFAKWSFYGTGGKDEQGRPKGVWRISEFLGLDRSESQGPTRSNGWQRVEQDPLNPALVILDDANLGFRDRKNRHFWPQAIKSPKANPWILLKMASPVAQGDLWEHLYETRADRLIVVMPVDDLRRTEVQISRELSWERTVQDLVWELTYNPRVNLLSRCAYLVISFVAAGALLLSRVRTERHRCSLFFDREAIEGVWGRDHKGSVFGYNNCLAAGIARQIMLSPDQPDLPQGIQSGLAGMRILHQKGYDFDPKASRPQLIFPRDLIGKELGKKEKQFDEMGISASTLLKTQEVTRCDQIEDTDPWTILQDRFTGSLGQVAQQIVLHGAEVALPGVPLGKFEGLLTVDRREIESFRSIRNLIREYYCHWEMVKPLSIAVFGPPGSGKSYGITQVATSLLPKEMEPKEFNLSQFETPEDIHDALHQVRDVGLKGKLPLVFWDEFDTALREQPLGWLRYFLAPMQDGTFQEGQITHPIGRAIFVFAGGTSTTMEDFSRRFDRKQLQDPKTVQELKDFREAKGPDFVSRLKAYVNILGPNRKEPKGDKTLVADPYYIIRRAIILRTLLRRHWQNIFKEANGKETINIDPGVLKGFLEIQEYKHGIRSMEALIATSLLHNKSRFERSSLPPEEQLNLHVDGREFLDLVTNIVLDENLVGDLELLASEVHKVFRRCYKLTNLPEKYQKLTPELKETNRSFVRDIPFKLTRVGYQIVRKRPGDPTIAFPEPLLDVLAEMEHHRWLKEKIDFGWRYGSPKDNARKLHPAILPWHRPTADDRSKLCPVQAAAMGPGELPVREKRKNRGMVKSIPKILAKAGYTIRKQVMVAIGVTGHRFLDELDKLNAGVAGALKRIAENFPGQPFKVISALAEGADRLVVHQVLSQPESRLVVPLPLAKNDYLTDFKSAQSKKEFLGLLDQAEEVTELPLPKPVRGKDLREAAYEALGQYLLDNCDVLLAVYDGQEAQGLGGTGGVVAEAKKRGLPIAWVHAGNRKPNTQEPTSLGPDQGKVSYENFR